MFLSTLFLFLFLVKKAGAGAGTGTGTGKQELELKTGTGAGGQYVSTCRHVIGGKQTYGSGADSRSALGLVVVHWLERLT